MSTKPTVKNPVSNKDVTVSDFAVSINGKQINTSALDGLTVNIERIITRNGSADKYNDGVAALVKFLVTLETLKKITDETVITLQFGEWLEKVIKPAQPAQPEVKDEQGNVTQPAQDAQPEVKEWVFDIVKSHVAKYAWWKVEVVHCTGCTLTTYRERNKSDKSTTDVSQAVADLF